MRFIFLGVYISHTRFPQFILIWAFQFIEISKHFKIHSSNIHTCNYIHHPPKLYPSSVSEGKVLFCSENCMRNFVGPVSANIIETSVTSIFTSDMYVWSHLTPRHKNILKWSHMHLQWNRIQCNGVLFIENCRLHVWRHLCKHFDDDCVMEASWYGGSIFRTQLHVYRSHQYSHLSRWHQQYIIFFIQAHPPVNMLKCNNATPYIARVTYTL